MSLETGMNTLQLFIIYILDGLMTSYLWGCGILNLTEVCAIELHVNVKCECFRLIFWQNHENLCVGMKKSTRRLLKGFLNKLEENEKRNIEQLSAKVTSNCVDRMHCMKRPAVLYYFWFFQVMWRHSKGEVKYLYFLRRVCIPVSNGIKIIKID